jgi:hypothetical protein
MFISGAIPYKNKKEKKAAWIQLKKEFGDGINIIFKDHYITYTAKVPRNFF